MALIGTGIEFASLSVHRDEHVPSHRRDASVNKSLTLTGAVDLKAAEQFASDSVVDRINSSVFDGADVGEIDDVFAVESRDFFERPGITASV